MLDCARPLFSSHGYDNTTMGLLADAAGMSVGALYLAFPGGKQEIHRALYSEALSRLEAAFDDALALPATDIRGRICILLYTYSSFFKSEYARYRILSGGLAGGEAPGDGALRARREALLRLLERPIAEGVRQGVVQTSDTYKTVVALWRMFDGILSLRDREDDPRHSAAFREYYVHGINIILDGLFR